MASLGELESLEGLGRAINHFRAGKKADPGTAIILLARALEAMLQEMVSAAGLEGEGRFIVGRALDTLREHGQLPEKHHRIVRDVLDVRNLAAHAGPVSTLSMPDAQVAKRQTLLLFEWYLRECGVGPKLTEEAADKFTDIDSPKAIKGRVFLCHAKEDHRRVESIYARLESDGFRPWMDKNDLLPGQNWEVEIRRAIERADRFVAFLSTHSVSKRGFVQKEMQFALDVLGEVPPDQIYFVPVRLEHCEVPERLSFIHYIDLDTDADYERLVLALRSDG